MIKQTLITIVTATAVAISAPRDVSEIARLIIRAATALIQLAVTLDPPGYNAGRAEPDDGNYGNPKQDAGLAAGAGSNHLDQGEAS